MSAQPEWNLSVAAIATSRAQIEWHLRRAAALHSYLPEPEGAFDLHVLLHRAITEVRQEAGA